MYFVVFNEFGFKPSTLYRLITKPYFHHNPGDVYDASSPTLGNSNLTCDNGNLTLVDDFGKTESIDGSLHGYVLDWLFTKDQR